MAAFHGGLRSRSSEKRRDLGPVFISVGFHPSQLVQSLNSSLVMRITEPMGKQGIGTLSQT